MTVPWGRVLWGDDPFGGGSAPAWRRGPTCRADFPRAPESCYRMPPVSRGQTAASVSLLPNSRRALLAFLHDVIMAALSFGIAFYLRLGDDALRYEPRLTVIHC